jgi:hypothetical protein
MHGGSGATADGELARFAAGFRARSHPVSLRVRGQRLGEHGQRARSSVSRAVAREAREENFRRRAFRLGERRSQAEIELESQRLHRERILAREAIGRQLRQGRVLQPFFGKCVRLPRPLHRAARVPCGRKVPRAIWARARPQPEGRVVRIRRRDRVAGGRRAALRVEHELRIDFLRTAVHHERRVSSSRGQRKPGLGQLETCVAQHRQAVVHERADAPRRVFLRARTRTDPTRRAATCAGARVLPAVACRTWRRAPASSRRAPAPRASAQSAEAAAPTSAPHNRTDSPRDRTRAASTLRRRPAARRARCPPPATRRRATARSLRRCPKPLRRACERRGRHRRRPCAPSDRRTHRAPQRAEASLRRLPRRAAPRGPRRHAPQERPVPAARARRPARIRARCSAASPDRDRRLRERGRPRSRVRTSRQRATLAEAKARRTAAGAPRTSSAPSRRHRRARSRPQSRASASSRPAAGNVVAATPCSSASTVSKCAVGRKRVRTRASGIPPAPAPPAE